MQEQMGQPSLMLIQEMETYWNSTYHMLQRVHEHKGTCRSSFGRSAYEHCPTHNRTEQYDIIAESLKVLSPFNDPTVELSEVKRVWGSKVIPLLAMRHHTLEEDGLL